MLSCYEMQLDLEQTKLGNETQNHAKWLEKLDTALTNGIRILDERSRNSS